MGKNHFFRLTYDVVGNETSELLNDGAGLGRADVLANDEVTATGSYTRT